MQHQLQWTSTNQPFIKIKKPWKSTNSTKTHKMKRTTIVKDPSWFSSSLESTNSFSTCNTINQSFPKTNLRKVSYYPNSIKIFATSALFFEQTYLIASIQNNFSRMCSEKNNHYTTMLLQYVFSIMKSMKQAKHSPLQKPLSPTFKKLWKPHYHR